MGKPLSLDRSGSVLPTDAAWALVAPYRSRLIAVARANGLSLPDAQDVAHHVLCKAVERRPLDPARVEAYLVRAAVVRCQDVREDAQRQEQVFVRSRGDDRLVGRVDEVVCDRDQVSRLLAKLPLRERRVVVLSVSGETVTGIAKATGLSYPTVDRLLSRARKEMRRLAGLAGVVAVAAWRNRRLAVPAGATAAVAVASVTFVTPPAVPFSGATAAPHARYVTSGPRPAAERATVGETVVTVRTTTRVARPAPADVGAAAPGRPRRPAVPVAQVNAPKPAPTTSDRLAECVKNGVSVAMGSPVTVRCGEERLA